MADVLSEIHNPIGWVTKVERNSFESISYSLALFLSFHRSNHFRRNFFNSIILLHTHNPFARAKLYGIFLVHFHWQQQQTHNLPFTRCLFRFAHQTLMMLISFFLNIHDVYHIMKRLNGCNVGGCTKRVAGLGWCDYIISGKLLRQN